MATAATRKRRATAGKKKAGDERKEREVQAKNLKAGDELIGTRHIVKSVEGPTDPKIRYGSVRVYVEGQAAPLSYKIDAKVKILR